MNLQVNKDLLAFLYDIKFNKNFNIDFSFINVTSIHSVIPSVFKKKNIEE